MAKKLTKPFFILITCHLFFLSNIKTVFSQTPSNYPKVIGFVGLLHPIITLSSSGSNTNFHNNYVVGFPIGINIWKTENVGFSIEIVPFIKAENGLSKMNNLLFHPGILLKMSKSLTFAGRVAFETNGRYGFTPVINKVVMRSKYCKYFVALPFPVRFGNNHPSSAGVGFQFGIAF